MADDAEVQHLVDAVALLGQQGVQLLGDDRCVGFQEGVPVALEFLDAGLPVPQAFQLGLGGLGGPIQVAHLGLVPTLVQLFVQVQIAEAILLAFDGEGGAP